jgi:nitrogen regulatory protein PII
MKEIRAYIEPFMLLKVTQTLLEIPDFPGMSVTDCEGFGRVRFIVGRDFSPYVPKKRIEIFASDDLVERIVNEIMVVANTHQHGAGKIYVLDVVESARISTGERGEECT